MASSSASATGPPPRATKLISVIPCSGAFAEREGASSHRAVRISADKRATFQMLITVSGSRTDSYRNAFTSQAAQPIQVENWTQCLFSRTLPKVSTARLLIGTSVIARLASAAFAGQDGTAPAFPVPTITVRDASALTNAPTPAMVTVVPEPALPEVTVPKPAEIAIPSATAVQSGPVAPAAHPQPVLPPTAQGLLSKSM